MDKRTCLKHSLKLQYSGSSLKIGLTRKEMSSSNSFQPSRLFTGKFRNLFGSGRVVASAKSRGRRSCRWRICRIAWIFRMGWMLAGIDGDVNICSWYGFVVGKLYRCIHTYIYMYIRMCMYIYIYKYTHTYIYIYTLVYIKHPKMKQDFASHRTPKEYVLCNDAVFLCKEPWEPNEMSMTCFPLPASSNMLVDVSWKSPLWITMIPAIKHSCTHWCSRLSHYAIVCAYMCFSFFLKSTAGCCRKWWIIVHHKCPNCLCIICRFGGIWQSPESSKKQLVSLPLSQTSIDGDVLLPSSNSLKDWICMVWRSTSSGIVSLPNTTWWSRCPHNCVRFTLQQTKIAGWELSLFNMEIQIFF